MNILTQAQVIYDKCDCPDMCRDIVAYMAYGAVYVTPESLLVMKPVRRDSSVSPVEQWGVERPDAWYFHAIIGNVRKLIPVIPYPLRWVCWERGVKRRPMKWFKYESLLRRQ